MAIDFDLLAPHFGEDRGQSVATYIAELDPAAQEAIRDFFVVVAEEGLALKARSPSFGSTAALANLAAAFRRVGQALIVNGVLAGVGETSGCVATGTATRYISTGCLISPDVVLTSRHFLGRVTRVSGEPSVVANPVGKSVRDSRAPRPGEIQHPFAHDIGLLFLHEPIPDPAPAKLQSAALTPAILTGRPVGYGATEPSGVSGYGVRRIAETEVTILHASPPTGDPDFDPATQFFADDPLNATDACVGDSGGPFIVQGEGGVEVAGIASRPPAGTDVCGEGTIYTRVHHFLGWIDDRIEECHGQPRPGSR